MKSKINELKLLLPNIPDVVENLRKESPKSLCGPCPKCGGNDRFVYRKDNGHFWCRQCNEKGGDKIDFHAWVNETDIKGLIKKYLPELEPFEHFELGHPEEIYSYTNENVKTQYNNCRFNNPKTFRQCSADGRSWKVSNIKRRVPYQLPKVLASETIYILEGEKDCHSIGKLNLVGTCNVGGAGNWTKDLNPYFKKKEIILLPDNDEPGKRHMAKVHDELKGIASNIVWLDLPDLPDGGDFTDWLNKFDDMETASERLSILVESAGPYKPQERATIEDKKAPGKQINNLLFPDSVISGVAGDFAKIYGEHLEPPDHFFFMSYLTLFGLSVSDKLCLYSHRRPEPRYYVILLGESGNTRKSTAIEETDEHFKNFYTPEVMAVCRGAASGEGIGKLLETSKKVLLYYDELKVFVSKCNIKNSTLLMAANILFESTQYENQTSKDPIVIKDARLAMLAASTTETYTNLFSPKFMDIGFNNRLFLVPGDSSKCFPVPVPIPKEKIEYLYGELKQRLKLIESTPEISIEMDASERWADFYKGLKGSSPYTKRLDVYGLRLMPLLAVNDMKRSVDLDIVNKIISLLEWQHNVRGIYDPIDAEGKVAKMEEKIRRAFKLKQKWHKRDLQRKVNYNQDGIWVWDSATTNLKKNDEIMIDARKKMYIAATI